MHTFVILYPIFMKYKKNVEALWDWYIFYLGYTIIFIDHFCQIVFNFCHWFHGRCCKFHKYSETCVKQQLKIVKKKFLLTNGSLMKVESIADAPLAFSDYWSLKHTFGSSFEWPL